MMNRRSLLALGYFSLGVQMAAVAPARAISLNNDVAANTVAAANIFDQGNQYPNVVSVNGCTGTLINARTVLTAAHCFYDNDRFAPTKPIDIRFGPDANVATRFDQHAAGLATGPGYTFSGTSGDIALVTLSTPVTGRSIAPVTLAGANDARPTPGALMVTVGYGQYGTGLDGGFYAKLETEGGAPSDQRRRVGETRFGDYILWNYSGRDPGTVGILAAQFRNPHSPSSPDDFGLAAKGFGVPAGQAGNGAGDSGGPLFLVRPDGSLLQVGVLALLEPASPDGTIRYGSISGWAAVQDYLDWLAANNPLREVSARQGNVLWSDTSAWSGGEVPDNVAGSLEGPPGSTGRYYDVRLFEPGRVTLDMNPIIDSLSLFGPRTVLDITADHTLEVVAGTGIWSGQMVLNGILQTPSVDMQGGVLSGAGTVRIRDYGVQDLWFGVHNQAGIIAPGNADQLGVLTIEGNYEQGKQGTLAARLGAGGSDRLAVTGTATVAGRVALSAFGSPTLNAPYAILTSTGLAGRFDTVQSDFAFLDAEIGYSVDEVTALLRRNAVAFADVAQTRNQVAASAALDTLAQSDVLYRNLVGLSAAEARSAFDLVSGEIHASLKSALIDDSRYLRDAANARLRDAPASAPVGGVRNAFAAMPGAARQTGRETRLEVWGQAFGATGHINGDGNAARLDRRSGGMLLGIDAPLDETWRLGALAGYNQGSLSAGARRSSAATDSFHIGLYGGGDFGAAFLRSGVFYSGHAIRTDRTVAVAEFVDHARADYRAGTLQAFGEIGWRWKAPLATVEPYVNLAHVRLTTNGFAEQGQEAALRAESQTSAVTFATTGLRGSTDFSIGAQRVTASLGAGWRRALDTQAPLAMLTLASADFAVAGVAIGRDAAVLDAGIAVHPTDNATVSLTYNGQVAASASQHALTARLKIGF